MTIFNNIYIIAAKWDNVGQVSANEPLTYKVEGLTPKKTYKFRIRAVNKLGPSEPGIFGKPILAKDPWGKYSHHNTQSAMQIFTNCTLAI